MATKKKPSRPAPKVPSKLDDPKAAKDAFDAVQSRLKAIAKKDILPVNVDLREASIIALAVARFIAEDEPKARFGLVHKDLFNPVHLTDLRPLALAAAHVHVALESARSQATDWKLPVGLVDDGGAVKERMLELCSYQFKKHPTVSKEVRAIRAGQGYRDLASDLVRLAKIYEDHQADVEHDRVNYQVGDAALARKLATRILEELGTAQSEEERKWTDLAARAWTLLRTCYDEVQSTGAFIYRHEDPDSKFPSLHANSGAGRPRTKGKDPVETAAAPPKKPEDTTSNGDL